MKYDGALDGLRGVAIWAVALYHTSILLLPGGWVGVDVFFVLSGYLISRTLTAEQDGVGRIRLGRFYLRRSLRLVPALAALLLAAFALALLSPERFAIELRGIGFAATYTMNWARAFHWPTGLLLGHTWSLAMEEQFYLVWPLLLLLTPRPHRLRLAAGLITVTTAWAAFLVFRGADPARIYNGFDTHSGALLLGCALAFRAPSHEAVAARWLSLASVAGLAALLFLVPRTNMVWQSTGMCLAPFISAALIVCARQGGWLRNLLQNRFLVFSGRISYGFYLWHYMLLNASHPIFHGWLRIVPLAASFGIAALSFHVLERPFLRLKDKFAARDGGSAFSSPLRGQ